MKPGTAIFVLCTAVLTLVGVGFLSRVNRAQGPAAGLVFYVLEPQTPLRLAIGTATALEMAVRFREAGAAARPLELVFRSLAGAELARERVDPRALLSGEAAPSTPTSRPSWIALAPPAGAAVLEVSVAGEGALIRLIGATADLLSQQPRTHRTGLRAGWLTTDEQRRLTPLTWTALPALSDATTVVLPLSSQHADRAANAVHAVSAMPDLLHADSDHALAFNIEGPGRATLRLVGYGRFVLRAVGSGAFDTREVGAPGSFDVDLQAGPVSIIVEARDGAAADATVVVTGARLLTRRASAASSHATYRLGRGAPLAYALDGNAPLRISACRLIPGASAKLSWRLLKAGHELARGDILLPADVDRFSFTGDAARSPVGPQVRRTLGLEGADAFELSAAADSLVQVDTWLEQGADTRPIEPFPAAPSGFRWIGVPARSPHWLALRPQGSQAETASVHVMRSPRLEAEAKEPAAASSFVSLRPTNGRPIELIEPTRHTSTHPTTLLRVPGDAQLMIADTGARARQITASCTANGAPTGELLLSVDGVVRARARMNVRNVQLRAAAQAGERRVTLAGSAASCLLDARPANGDTRVRRSVFELPQSGGLRLAIDTAAKVRTVYVALYRADLSPGSLEVRVDDGNPKRHPGVFETQTIPEVARSIEKSESQAVRLPDAALLHRSLTRVVLGDDLVSGHHVLEFVYQGSSHAWARFWTTGNRAHHERVKLWIAEEPAE